MKYSRLLHCVDSGSPLARGSIAFRCCLLCPADEVEGKQGAIRVAHRCQSDKFVVRFRPLRTYADIPGELQDLERLVGSRCVGPQTVVAWQYGIVILLSVAISSSKGHGKRVSSSGIKFQPSGALSPNFLTKRLKRAVKFSLIGGSSFGWAEGRS